MGHGHTSHEAASPHSSMADRSVRTNRRSNVTQQIRNQILFYAVLAAFAAPVHAITSIWDGGGVAGNTNWGAAGNWSGNVAPASTNDVEIGSSFASGTNIQLAGNRTVNSLIINTLTAFSISGGPTDVLTITSGALTRDDPAGDEGNHTINTAVAIGADANWSVWGSGALTINGPLNGAGHSLTKFGWGFLVLNNGSGNFNGQITVDETVLQLNGVWNSPGVINVIAGAGVDISAANISSPFNLRGDGYLNWGALRALSASTVGGPITLLANSTISAKSEVLTINGLITDNFFSY